VGELVEQHNMRMVKEVVGELRQLKEALYGRTPEEIVIRYHDKHPERGNGRLRTKEVAHA
jgi:hypothetical protein